MDSQTEDIVLGYVLGILDADQVQAFEIAVTKHPALRSHVEAWQQHVHMLALGAPLVAPAPNVKRELLARVQATKVVRSGSAAGQRSLRQTFGWAALLAVVLALGGWNVALRNENATLRDDNVALSVDFKANQATRTQLAEQLAQANQAMDFLVAQETTARALIGTASAPKAKGTMYMQPGNITAVLILDGLEPLPEGRTYQFWLAREGGAPVPNDTFTVDASGHASLIIKANDQVNAFKQVMVTIEPTAGSSQPSDGATVLEGNL